jgi:hypothetical protein
MKMKRLNQIVILLLLISLVVNEITFILHIRYENEEQFCYIVADNKVGWLTINSKPLIAFKGVSNEGSGFDVLTFYGRHGDGKYFLLLKFETSNKEIKNSFYQLFDMKNYGVIPIVGEGIEKTLYENFEKLKPVRKLPIKMTKQFPERIEALNREIIEVPFLTITMQLTPLKRFSR